MEQEETKNPIDQPVEELPVGEIDLDKARDEKCAPIAQEVIAILADEIVSTNTIVDYRSTAMKVLALCLTADLNLTTETTYVPQLVLNGLSSLNAILQQCDFTPLDDERYKRIAQQLLHILHDANVRLAGNADELQADMASSKDRLNALITEEKITSIELKYITDSIFTSFNMLNNLVTGSIEQSMARAESKLFGVDTMTDVSMKKLDEILKA